MKNVNFKINFDNNNFGHELRSLTINDRQYELNELSHEAKELLTIMSYGQQNKNDVEYYDKIANILGYDTTLQGILDLMELGANVATSETYRQLVMNSFKNKYKGLMR